jgi:hypothetical protein
MWVTQVQIQTVVQEAQGEEVEHWVWVEEKEVQGVVSWVARTAVRTYVQEKQREGGVEVKEAQVVVVLNGSSLVGDEMYCFHLHLHLHLILHLFSFYFFYFRNNHHILLQMFFSVLYFSFPFHPSFYIFLNILC